MENDNRSQNNLSVQKKICHIVGAGSFKKFSYSENDCIIAADGGYDHLAQYQIQPHILIGDFDSIKNIPHDIKKIILPKAKDFTDTYAAVEEGIKLNFQTFYIHGGSGKRFDHTLANIQLICKLAQENFEAYLFDKNFTLTAICNRQINFDENHEGYISIFSHSDKSFGVSIKNLKYELTDATIANNFPLGISNEFIHKKSFIRVKDGTLILVY